MVGMSSAVFGLARQSYLTETVPFRYRARALSTLGGVMRIGLFLGPFVAAGLIHAMGIGGAYWAGVGALVLVGARRAAHARPAGARRADAARPTPPPCARRRRCARSAPATPGSSSPLGLGALLVAAVRASRQAVIPLWAESIGLDAATTSLIYGLAGGIDMLVFYPAGKVMDRKRPRLGRGAVDADHGRGDDADAVHAQRRRRCCSRRC